jgi:hypothetical protein
MGVAVALDAAVLLGCGGQDAASPDTPRGGVRGELVGDWADVMTTTRMIDDLTDHLVRTYEWPPDAWNVSSGPPEPTSFGVGYGFTRDGGYAHTFIPALGGGRAIGWKEKGTVTVSGTRITLHPAFARAVSVDQSVPKNNYDRPARAKSITLTATPGRDRSGAEMLMLAYPSGGTLALYRRPY